LLQNAKQIQGTAIWQKGQTLLEFDTRCHKYATFSGINICFQSSVFLVRFAEVHTLMCFHILNFDYLFACFGRFSCGPGEDMKFGKSDLICPEFAQVPHYITLFLYIISYRKVL
jgi:hypothetical protein